MQARNPNTGTLETVYVKALDSMPVGTIVDYDGQVSDIPAGWETYGTGQIKKTSETRALAGNITSAYNDSQTSAYSTEYANKAFGGTILWTNPSPTSNMSSGTTITLSSDDYDVLEIFYDIATGLGALLSVKITKGKGARLTYSAIGVNAYGFNSMRELTYVSDTSYTAQVGYFQRTNANAASTDNSRIIPLYIIGYKTGLFN